jgi:subtilisin family serine protease
MGHLSRTTGADQARSADSSSSLDGSGIGIAIIDSGIDVDHHSFLNNSNGVRVVYSEDFTSIRTRNSRRVARGRQRSHLKRRVRRYRA